MLRISIRSFKGVFSSSVVPQLWQAKSLPEISLVFDGQTIEEKCELLPAITAFPGQTSKSFWNEFSASAEKKEKFAKEVLEIKGKLSYWVVMDSFLHLGYLPSIKAFLISRTLEQFSLMEYYDRNQIDSGLYVLDSLKALITGDSKVNSIDPVQSLFKKFKNSLNFSQKSRILSILSSKSSDHQLVLQLTRDQLDNSRLWMFNNYLSVLNSVLKLSLSNRITQEEFLALLAKLNGVRRFRKTFSKVVEPSSILETLYLLRSLPVVKKYPSIISTLWDIFRSALGEKQVIFSRGWISVLQNLSAYSNQLNLIDFPLTSLIIEMYPQLKEAEKLIALHSLSMFCSKGLLDLSHQVFGDLERLISSMETQQLSSPFLQSTLIHIKFEQAKFAGMVDRALGRCKKLGVLRPEFEKFF